MGFDYIKSKSINLDISHLNDTTPVAPPFAAAL